MDFEEIFQAYYTLFRADSDVPAEGDDEFTVGMRMANEAISRWANYDGTYWKELYDTNQNSGTGTQTITDGTTTYTAPEDFQEAGGFVKVLSGTTEKARYPIIEPSEVQFQGASAKYCYFTGNPSDGYTLNLNPAPNSELDGLDIDYVYYKKPTYIENKSDVPQMSNPYFIVHRMLAQQFRASRNPYYSSALRDAEDALKIMEIDNNSGSWANPWSQTDNSGTTFGA